eukprot:scaffold327_cov189-Alexandrium_tamarense.AAC.41
MAASAEEEGSRISVNTVMTRKLHSIVRPADCATSASFPQLCNFVKGQYNTLTGDGQDHSSLEMCNFRDCATL